MPIITLTSDFGAGSPYVAAMKAALLADCPAATLVDISHEVPPLDILGGAFVLWAGSRHFPTGTIHLSVVDPGVGSDRRPVAFLTRGSWHVGPDNGLFGLVVEEAGSKGLTIWELARPVHASPTFEGRDVFAPAAAALARGNHPSALGIATTKPLERLPDSGPKVLWVDNFGNLVTNVRPPVAGLRVRDQELRTWARTYAAAPPGQLFLYQGSMGLVEIGLHRGRADVVLGARGGERIGRLD